MWSQFQSQQKQKSKTTEASLKILQHPKMIEWQAKHGNFQAPPLKIKNAAQNGTQNGTQNDPNEASNQEKPEEEEAFSG